jgi:hypothetical protein
MNNLTVQWRFQMKSITIHGLDDMLDKQIRQNAKNQGISLNKAIKKLLEKALGINQNKKIDHKEEFMDLFGTWSEEDLKEFNTATSDFRKIDPGIWGQANSSDNERRV